MRIGVIARGEARGLGIQTLEVCRHLNPLRVILVDMGSLAGHFEFHPEWYEQWNTTVVAHGDMGDRSVIGPLVRDLDVVYFAETPYKWEFCDIARHYRCATVCHLNPEFYSHNTERLAAPSAWWLPSRWLRHDDRLPSDAELVPMPCPTDRWPNPREPYDGIRPLRILHVSGHAAMGDRNGTRSLLAALRHVTSQVAVTVTTQDRHLPSPARLGRGVAYGISAGVKEYWRLYDGYDVIVLPRRYGGLCLPALEAAGAGLALVMTDCEPNGDYPAWLVNTVSSAPLNGKLGSIPTYTADAKDLASTIDMLAETPASVASLQRAARDWAQDMSWDQWADRWRTMMETIEP